MTVVILIEIMHASVRFCLSVLKNAMIIFFILGVCQTVSGSGVSNHLQWPLDKL